ncbi:hypothetical protein [Yoonia sp. I 8.24]|uniref:hypothetical protein n=1 Tax=Yoonia sp. I 8.24 TaxID=1537229 RepID=UPI001EDD5C24|nr:hypothetical protein [Yoonia sp. I 8.24]MCG3268205.1 hypothetical protein [Yoonia sp. I 8.24]
MSVFATEFQVKTGISKAAFVASVVAWLRGINRSQILDSADAHVNYDDEVWLETAEGESLSLKSYEHNQMAVFGSRLEILDNLGRKWRTECVLTDFGNAAFLRVRGQCVAVDASAVVIPPKKPHFIRQAIEDGWCVEDGHFLPSLSEISVDSTSIDTATNIILGGASFFLPVLYISRGNQDHLPFKTTNIAKELAGICHVVVEPSRAFSFELMERTKRKNPYGGAVALFAPDGREVFKFFKKSDDHSGTDLVKACVQRTNEFVSSQAAQKAWEWQDLQEAQSRRLREAVTNANAEGLEDYVAAFDTELAAKEEKIQNLEARLLIETARANNATQNTDDLFPTDLKTQIGPELYDGEFTDRLHSFLSNSLDAPSIPRNPRTDEFVKRLLENLEFSGRSQSLVSQIKSACRDGNQMPKQLGSILSGFGFTKSNDGPHLKFQPPKELFGLQTEVLPSTPSDSQRAGKNRGAEVIRSFGLNELK